MPLVPPIMIDITSVGQIGARTPQLENVLFCQPVEELLKQYNDKERLYQLLAVVPSMFTRRPYIVLGKFSPLRIAESH
jgi:hypothetical protein